MVPHGGRHGATHLALPAMKSRGPWKKAPLGWPQEGTGLMGGLRGRVMENVASSAAQPPIGPKADPFAQMEGPDAAIGADCRRLCGKAEVWPVEQQVRA
jgi:hypothetical protein